MIDLKSHTEGTVISVRIDGKLTSFDYYELVPSLIKLPHQPIKNLYCEIKFMEKWEYRTLHRHADAFDKVAIVGDKELEGAIQGIIQTFTSTEGRYFSTSQKEEAINWLTG